MKNCPICCIHGIGFNVEITDNPNVKKVTCRICGEYNLSLHDEVTIRNKYYDDKRYIFSGITRNHYEKNSIINFNLENEKLYLKSLLIPKNIFESLYLILQYIEMKSSHAGEFQEISFELDYPISFAKNVKEFMRHFRIMEFELKLIERNSGNSYQLTSNGWEKLYELKNEIADSKQIFVAMDFKDKENLLAGLWDEGFKSAIEKTGYNWYRVDKDEHNDKIDDKIIAGIKRSICVIADFTYNNAGAYFEAGFAKGLGREVIWTCQKKFFETEGLHFDTNHFNHILWDNAEDLKIQLIDRISATLPIIA